MKIRNIIILLAALLLAACNKGDRYLFQHYSFKETLPYKRGQEHPCYTFDVKAIYACGYDSVFNDGFNRDISEFLFDTATTDVRAAMISCIDRRIDNFREYHENDFEYFLRTEIGYGNHKDIINCDINIYEYWGGAHGGTVVACRNYHIEDGSVVTQDEYFMPGYKEALIPVLDSLLLIHAGVTDRSQLDDNGYFSMQPMYVPEYFRIREDSIDFIFNQYEIAPYSTGVTTLTVAESDIRDLIR